MLCSRWQELFSLGIGIGLPKRIFPGIFNINTKVFLSPIKYLLVLLPKQKLYMTWPLFQVYSIMKLVITL